MSTVSTVKGKNFGFIAGVMVLKLQILSMLPVTRAS